jgi:NAD(P)-dependent dehydrogenase (short-subunit alcohol dehydrogenase family)
MSYLDDLFSLKGRKAVVTGGAGQLPADMAVALAKAGADVCLWGRGSSGPMSAAAARVRETAGGGSGRIEAVTIDTSDAEACVRAIAETEALIGAPDILVNGVGGNRGKADFVDLDEKVFMEVVTINLMGGLVTPTRAFARYWIERGIRGNVICISSMASYKGLSGVWAYDAAKAGVFNLTAALAKEFAPHGIRVNGVAPGFFLGAQNKALLVDQATGELTDRGRAITGRTPFGRFGDKSELRGAVVYLASDAASGFVTGVTIPVDGGYLADNV